jgi:hypothetical protein
MSDGRIHSRRLFLRSVSAGFTLGLTKKLSFAEALLNELRTGTDGADAGYGNYRLSDGKMIGIDRFIVKMRR